MLKAPLPAGRSRKKTRMVGRWPAVYRAGKEWSEENQGGLKISEVAGVTPEWPEVNEI
ncbi:MULTISPECIES: hypothetical protein [unclassified Desulfovibrio]|uniref:hypothetical protein n=1 Tax=unclassified Desulfovibrio TaxID=2593640 RepID=UPI002FDB1D39